MKSVSAPVPTQVRHPIFARVYRRLAANMERVGSAEHRDRLVADLVGMVVEVGVGSGLNLAHYPPSVSEVIAVEPEPYLRACCVEAARQASVPTKVVDGTAEHLPLDGSSADAGVVSLVSCSVPDQQAALAELRRVIRPGGELRFYEHVLSADPAWARRQHRLDKYHTVFAGGCHVDRDTETAISSAGFRIEECDRFQFAPCALAKLAGSYILGRAERVV